MAGKPEFVLQKEAVIKNSIILKTAVGIMDNSNKL
jgi:hypothetical protein